MNNMNRYQNYDMSEMSYRDHVSFCKNAHSKRKREKQTQRGGGRHQGGVCQVMSEWKRRYLHIQERETEIESLSATSSYRQLERNSHWLNSNHHSKCAFYSNWTCSWFVVGYRVRSVWISWRSVWRKPLQVRCVVVTALCESENSALLLSFILTGLFIWAPTSNWQDLDLSNVCFWSDRNKNDQ